MSRYLTPSKICLLALIDVYREGTTPSDTTVPLLSFLVTSVLPSKKISPSPLPLQTFEKTLSTLQSSIPGRTIWDFFLARIWALENADSLYAFFDDLEHAIQKPKPSAGEEDEEDEVSDDRMKLTKTSPLGSFMRRCQVEFTRMNFQDSVQLWKNFVAYRGPSHMAWAKRSGPGAVSRSLIDSNLEELPDALIQGITYGDLSEDGSLESRYSTEDIERLLDYYVADVSKTGNRLPDEIRTRLSELANSGITVPSASHYIGYLDAWKAGDYPAALDALHRYFDYTIQTRDKSHYQYALLNMALLHAHFGAHTEAVSAMQETVATARENRDTACLNYSLSWLYHFGQAHPEATRDIQKSGVLGRGKEALAFLQSKARESSSWGLLSSSLVADARLTMLQGEGLASAMENLVRASYLNLTRRLPSAIGSSMATEAALWARLAVAPLADVRDELFLECYKTGTADADAVQAICRRAAALAARGRYNDSLAVMDATPAESLRTLTNNAVWCVGLGMLKLQHSIRRQDFDGAKQYLIQLHAITGSLSVGSAINSSGANADPDTRLNVASLEIQLALARGELEHAFSLIDRTSRALDAIKADVFHRVRLMLLKGRLWACAGQAPRGFSIILRACSIAYASRLLTLLWDGITILSSILVALGEFMAARELLVAVLPHILATMDCEAAAKAYVALADVHVGLAGRAGRDPGTALGTSSPSSSPPSSSPQSTKHGPSTSSTAKKTTPSKKQVASPSQSPSSASSEHDQAAYRRKEEIAKALEYLSRGFDQWSAIEDVAGQTETLAKKAMLLHLSGDSQLANDCAAKYRDIKERVAQEQHSEGVE